MIGTSLWLLREFVTKTMLGDASRGLTAAVATIGLMWQLPRVTSVIAIPLCIGVFAVLAFLLGAVTRDDVRLLMASFGQRRRPGPQPAIATDQITPSV